MTNRTFLSLLGFLILFWGLSSCSKQQSTNQEMLRHTVCFQFAEEVSEERRAQAVQDFLEVQVEIPEIKKMEGGAVVGNVERSKGFTHCFVLSFENEAARDVYLPHPAHVAVVEKNKPLLSDLLVVDFWGKE